MRKIITMLLFTVGLCLGLASVGATASAAEPVAAAPITDGKKVSLEITAAPSLEGKKVSATAQATARVEYGYWCLADGRWKFVPDGYIYSATNVWFHRLLYGSFSCVRGTR